MTLLALVAGGQIEVDVRPLAALLGEEPLEEELHLHRIDGRDRERVADGAVGGGAAALHEDPVLEAEAHDVPDDQEVAGEIELLDHRELFLDLRLRARRQRTEARARAVPRDLPQVRGRRLAGRQRVLGEAVAEIREREVEALRELGGVVERLRQVGEELGHLARVLEVAARAAAARSLPAASSVVWWRIAGEDVVEVLVARARVAHAVRRDERQAMRRARSTSAWLRCSSSRRRWRWSSTCSAAREDRGEPRELRLRRVEPRT